MNKPIICIDGGGGYDPRFECESWATNKTYVNAVSAAGGIPVLCYDDACAEDMAKECDGLILTGAFVYIPRQELRARGTAVGRPKRVKLDRALYEAFKAAGKPIYGICLGEQCRCMFYLRFRMPYSLLFRSVYVLPRRSFRTISL